MEMESVPSTSGSSTEQDQKLFLTHALQYAIKLLREEDYIEDVMVETDLSDGEKEIGTELRDRILEAMDEMVLVEDEELIAEDEIDESGEYCSSQETEESLEWEEEQYSNTGETYVPEAKRTKQDPVPWDIKVKAVTAAKLHPVWSWKTIQRKVTRQLHSATQLSKWKQLVEEGGSTLNKYSVIQEWTNDRFVEARRAKQHVSTRLLRQWALQGANQFLSDTFHFTASFSWVERFRATHRIRHRKVTRYVSKKDTMSFEEIMKSAEMFQQQVRHIIPFFDADYVINTDQTGCEYKLESKRTFSHQGEKATEVATTSLSKMTHSYTAQYALTLSGKLLPKVFLCLRETGGRFGVRVAEDVQKQQEELGNVHVVCTKSGKFHKATHEEFLKSVMQPYVKTEKFLYLLDSWSGQTDPVLYDELFINPEEENAPTCTLKVVPPKCTPMCQPCDVYFYRQIKNFLRRLQNANELIMANKEISDRKDIIKLHSLIHNQLSAPIFETMIKYAWFASKLTPISLEKEVFCNVNQVCFPPDLVGKKCSCSTIAFVQCAWCRKAFCFTCFYEQSHGVTCRYNNIQPDDGCESE